ncbi:MAG TPA: helix-turn-helix domain-containing protein [Vicinamibacterales bacterium]|nr:helix-turn-helix domain-containing protein [Vicinamibacterales bacterium]
MNDLGSKLKRAREDHGIALRDIAARTKISVTALEAVERNDFSRLPGGIFGRSFVRAYAAELGLDADAIVAEFVEALEEQEREAAARGAIRPEITDDDRLFLARQQQAVRLLRWGLIALAVVAVALVVWRLHVWRSRRAATPTAVTMPAASSTTTPPPVSSPPTSPPSTTSGPDGTAANTAAVVTTSSVTDASSPGASPAADAANGVAVEFLVSDDCWIVATSDGQRSISELFRAGDGRRLDATRELLFDVGNAGAVEWSINGHPAKPLGRAGQHVRVVITPANVSQFLQP